jgi:hypothetical protein
MYCGNSPMNGSRDWQVPQERDVSMRPDARAALEEQLEDEDKLWKQNPRRGSLARPP